MDVNVEKAMVVVKQAKWLLSWVALLLESDDTEEFPVLVLDLRNAMVGIKKAIKLLGEKA
jgi:hypothetical protein